MGHTGTRSRRLTGAVATALGLLLAGGAAGPAHAESARERQWHLDAMQAEKMWEVSKGEGVTVAVIDTGVDASLPDLQGQVLKGKDFSNLPGDAHDDYAGHGTGMASLIAATGAAGHARGTMGLAPEVKILPLRIYSGSVEDSVDNFKEGNKKFAASLARAISYAANSEAQILNISMASIKPSPKVQSAIEYALSKNKLIFAGTGNMGETADPLMYPAATPGVVGVGAIGKDGNVTEESVTGPQVDLVAPGEDVIYSCPGGSQLCEADGTSDATALASASAALIWAQHPDWTANQVTRVLVETAGGPDSGKERTDYVGYGAVRPRIALLEGPVDPGDPDTNPLPASPYFEGNATTSPEPSAGSDDAKAPDSQNDAASPAGDDADRGLSTGAWIGYGLMAAAVVAAVIGTPLLLARRRRNHAVSPAAPFVPGPPPGPGGQPAQWPQQHGNPGGHRHD